MGSNSSAPIPPSPPTAPSYAQAIQDAYAADISTLPARLAAQRDAQKQYLEQIAPIERQNQSESALATAKAALEVQKQYGSAFNEEALRQIAQSDPAGFAARNLLAQNVYQGLLNGTELDPTFVRQLQQEVRGAQAARGNILGDSAAAVEGDVLANAGRAQQQQAFSNASSYVFGTPITAQYGNLQKAQEGPAPFQPQPIPGYVGLNPNDASLGSAYARGIYGDQMDSYNAGLNYLSDTYRTEATTPNPWLQGLGLAVNGIRYGAKY